MPRLEREARSRVPAGQIFLIFLPVIGERGGLVSRVHVRLVASSPLEESPHRDTHVLALFHGQSLPPNMNDTYRGLVRARSKLYRLYFCQRAVIFENVLL